MRPTPSSDSGKTPLPPPKSAATSQLYPAVSTQRRRGTFTIVAVYVLISGLWIIFSDQVAAWIAPDPQTLLTINTLKGWGYTLVTALLLYWLIRRHTIQLLSARGQSEAALRQAEEKYRDIFENVAEGIFQTTPDGRYLSANPALARIYGYASPAELISSIDNLAEQVYVDPDRRAEFVRLLAEHGEVRSFENANYRRDGRMIWVRVNARVVRDAAGASLYYEGSLEDITERKYAVEALREASEFNRQIISSTQEGIIVTDRSLRCLVWNPFMEQISGLRATEVMGQPLSKILPDWQAQGLDNLMVQALEGETRSSRDLPYTFAAVQRSGWLWYKIGPVQDIQGYVIGAIVMVYDITERKRNENRIAYQANLLANVNDAVVASDDQFTLTAWNRAAEQMFGWKTDEVIGQPGDKVLGFGRDINPMDREAALRAMQTHGEFHGEGIIERKDGAPLWVEAKTIALHDQHNQITGFVGVIRDISKRKRAEEALQISQVRFQRYFELGLIGMAITSPTKGWIEVNDQICEILGYKRDELLQTTWPELTHPDDLAADVANFDQVLAGKIDGYSMDKRFIRKDGQIVYATISLKCLRRADGSVDYIVALLQDITERKRIEAAEREQRVLAEALRDTAAILNSTLDVEEVMDRILENVEKVVPLDTADLILLTGDAFHIVRSRGYERHNMPAAVMNQTYQLQDFTNLRHIANTRQVMVIEDVQRYEDWVDLPDFRWVRSYLGAPILVQNQVVGFINLDAAQPGFYTQLHAKHLQAFANQAAIALQNAQLVAEVRDRAKELSTSHEQLRALSAHLQSVREEERTLISREIHDDLGQALTGLKMDLAWLDKRLAAGDVRNGARSKVQDMSALVDTTIQSVRRLATQLRPGILDDLGLVAAIDWQLQDFQRRTGLRCEWVSNAESVLLPDQSATEVFRIFQEALTNVARHAQASQVDVRLMIAGHTLTLEVKDDGRGIEAQSVDDPRSLGLLGMRERALLVGGELKVAGVRDAGTVVTVRIPLADT